MDRPNVRGKTFFVTEDPECPADYRHYAHPPEKIKAKHLKALRDTIILSAAAQEQLFIIVEPQKVEPGYKCSNCGSMGEHLGFCNPPRGLVKVADAEA